jgi:hypothetical protein
LRNRTAGCPVLRNNTGVWLFCTTRLRSALCAAGCRVLGPKVLQGALCCNKVLRVALHCTNKLRGALCCPNVLQVALCCPKVLRGGPPSRTKETT